ncbi:MAG TPA: DNA-binding domain-containing protein [Gammaproteobacteria bacterium]|nr:DNA-binding domain-containing protein [Gammaproteobacteria bacterium]
MRSLADLQGSFARAMTTGEVDRFDVALVGGLEPRNRIAIHVRHYGASLTAALCDKFPASAWLAGADLVRDAARTYARLHPPSQPCIAEYGADFPEFLAAYGRAPSVPYLESFAALEWAVGQASIAIERAPCSWPELASQGSERLLDSTLSLQPGLHYRHSRWRVDELMTTYLSGVEPESFVLAESSAFVEVRGALGAVRLARLDAAAFAFRSALAEGRSIAAAAAAALDCDPGFDSGEALRSLAHAGLVTGVSTLSRESPR